MPGSPALNVMATMTSSASDSASYGKTQRLRLMKQLSDASAAAGGGEDTSSFDGAVLFLSLPKAKSANVCKRNVVLASNDGVHIVLCDFEDKKISFSGRHHLVRHSPPLLAFNRISILFQSHLIHRISFKIVLWAFTGEAGKV